MVTSTVALPAPPAVVRADKRKAFPDAHQQVEQPEFAGGAPRGVGAPSAFGVWCYYWNYHFQRCQWARDPAGSPRSVLETDHTGTGSATETEDSTETNHSLFTPPRRILAGATSPCYLKRNSYYSKLKEKKGEVVEKTMADVLWDETKPLSNGGKERKGKERKGR